jgi:protein-S-isoprenylcysteine O-methyltransferase Ste14
MMAVIALVLYLVYLVLCFGVRAVVLHRRTGDTGFRGISGRPGSDRWWAGALFAIAIVVGFLGPVAGLIGVPSVHWLSYPAIQVAAAAVVVAGIALTAVTQFAMGDSWRVGVDANERTELVTRGPFAIVRNPIFSAMLITSAGLALMVPNVVAVAGWVALLLAVQLQVRVVEEPYLLQAHTDHYPAYAARTGRFVPGFGRMQTIAPGPSVILRNPPEKIQ